MKNADSNELPKDPPEWYRRAAEKEAVPTEKELQPFAPYMEALSAAFAHAAAETVPQKQSADSIIHAIFSTAGELLQRAEQLVGEILPRAAMQYATRDVAQPKTAGTLISGIDFPTGKVLIRLEWHRDGGDTLIEVQALNPDGTPLRPLTLTITDATTHAQLEQLHLTATQTHPRLPNPSPGIYLFEFTWPGGREQLRIAVQPQ